MLVFLSFFLAFFLFFLSSFVAYSLSVFSCVSLFLSFLIFETFCGYVRNFTVILMTTSILLSDFLDGLVVKRPPREHGLLGSTSAFPGQVMPVSSSSAFPALGFTIPLLLLLRPQLWDSPFSAFFFFVPSSGIHHSSSSSSSSSSFSSSPSTSSFPALEFTILLLLHLLHSQLWDSPFFFFFVAVFFFCVPSSGIHHSFLLLLLLLLFFFFFFFFLCVSIYISVVHHSSEILGFATMF